ncbi:MAG: primosomal protein N' [Dehalobacterium sp.]
MPVKAQFAEIIINKAVQAVDRIFHYRIPDRLSEQIEVGSIVKVPFGRQKLEGMVVGFVDVPEVDQVKDIDELVYPFPLLSKDLIDLASWMAKYYLCPRASALQCMLPGGLKRSSTGLRGKLVEYCFLVLPSHNLGKDGKKPGRLGPKQKLILSYLAKHPGSPVSLVLATTGAPRSSLNSLLKKGLIQVKSEEIYRDPYDARTLPPAEKHRLTEEQIHVLKSIANEYALNNRPVLLHGVTGSGKTEIYLRLVEKMLAQGKESIILVPEISLTPQLVSVFKSRLGERVAVLHSGLSWGERRDAWVNVARGFVKVVVGARSAVFAPCFHLGLIIMDEEHEPSYKQDNVPRFHAREVARARCRLQKASFLMGSATPSVETYYKAVEGSYQLIKLKNRIHHRPLPPVKIVDMRQELKEGNRSIFSRLLQDKLKERFSHGEQSLLFLNRRGYHTFVSCRTCGTVLECSHCNISLTSHGGNSRLKCHYCGYSIPVPRICPQCGSEAIRHFGTGTERVAEEVKKLLPKARVARVDGDTTSRKGSYEKIYFGVKSGEVDVLVGTQMIAKGLDFPLVTLVGVISADMALHLPEMRAGERAFQLITQVSGRAGRGELAGEVVLQTYNPHNATLLAAARQDYDAYFQEEIEKRRISGYPPFGSMIRILFSGEDHIRLQREAEIIAHFVKVELNEDNETLGPAPAPLEKIKDRFRIQMIIKTGNLAQTRLDLVRGLDLARRAGFPHKIFLVAVDVEPLNMM